jgi:condensin complex subunit 1
MFIARLSFDCPCFVDVQKYRTIIHMLFYRANASLALTKFMLVSSEFCEKHLQLIFTMLEKATEPIIRANLIIALGDLSFRYSDQSVLTYLQQGFGSVLI